MKAYTHSKVFEDLKATKEKVSDNYTSLQYLQTLDMFLWNALEPIIIECPTFFKVYATKMVGRQIRKASAKFSSDDRGKLPIHLFNLLTSDNPKKMIENAKLHYFNRGILFGAVNLFLAQTQRYTKLSSPFHKMDMFQRRAEMRAIEQLVGMRPSGNLYGAIEQVKHWSEKAREWHSQIVEKYTRMTIMQAQACYKDYNHAYPLDDTIQVFMTVMIRAINRCDARQGVLTTFIQNWLKSARSEVDDIIRKMNKDQSFEALTEEYGDAITEVLGFTDADKSYELRQALSKAAKRADPNGIVRVMLGIPEFITYEDRQTLELFVDQVYEDRIDRIRKKNKQRERARKHAEGRTRRQEFAAV
ncbi:hypothetical protein [Burkholderia phage BCSR5]|nr:hypothetical protein [Burkholderia phage BCSR5]